MLLPWGEHFDLALRTCRERSEDMRSLNHPIPIMGMDLVFENSIHLGDTPVLLVAKGNKTSGNYSCSQVQSDT